MELKVGDKVKLNLNYLLIEKRGQELNGLTLDNVKSHLVTKIKSIDIDDMYPIRTEESRGGTNRFKEKELIKVEEETDEEG
jgi:hypothetical protein